jgi:C4-type Zn-finger protein
MDEEQRVRCPNPECGRTLAARMSKGKVEVKIKRSPKKVFAFEIVVGAIICPRCGYRLHVPVSTLEVPQRKPLNPSKEAQDARGP